MSAVASGNDSWLAIDNSGARFGVTTTPARLPKVQAHVLLETASVDRAVAFYAALIDVKFDRVIDDDMDFVAMSRDNGREPVGGIIDVGDLYRSRSQASPQWVPYFPAADVDAEAARALELGALMRIPPVNSPLDRYAVLADPTGAMFCLSNAVFEEWPDHARFTEYPLSRQP
jgi:predicted enzyme related to lactoylglutathione lyase